MTEEELAELDDPDAPNLPAAIPGQVGLAGPKPFVPPDVQRQRRALMSAMLVQGAARDDIRGAFALKFQMSQAATDKLIADVRASWDDDDAERARYTKAEQSRRLRQEIREATKDRKWTAVANLEKVLAEVEGNNVNEEDKPIDVDARLSEAIMHVLGETDSKTVRVMIERERTFVELGGPDRQHPALVKATIVESPSEGGG